MKKIKCKSVFIFLLRAVSTDCKICGRVIEITNKKDNKIKWIFINCFSLI